MDLRLFEIFCCVYEEKSFSKAAERLFLTQPTISEHIKSLESYFDTKLFDRLGRQIAPTRAGELLYEYGKRIKEAKKATMEGMRNFLNRLEGKLVVGGSTIPGEYILPGVFAAFHKQFPGVELTLKIADTKEIITDVRQGNVELGFVGAKINDRNLEFEKFATDELVLAAPFDKQWAKVKTISIQELTTKPFIVRELGSGTQMTIEQRLEEAGYPTTHFRIAAVIGSTSGVKEAIKAGLGVSIISSLAIGTEIKAGVLKAIPIRGVANFTRDFYIVSEKRKYHSPLCKALLQTAMSLSEAKFNGGKNAG